MNANAAARCVRGRAARKSGLARAALAAGLLLLGSRGGRATAGELPFWAGAARAPETRAAALVAEAGPLIARDRRDDVERRLGPGAEAPPGAARDRLGPAEALLVEAAALRPGDVPTVEALAELQALRDRDAAAQATLERLLERLPPGSEPTLWLQLGALRAKRGAYGEAAAAYEMALHERVLHERVVGAGAAAAGSDVYANLGEVLMADGRLGAAVARYRDAVAVAAAETTGERRPRSQDLALAYYGLAVALDRDHQPAAAREAMGRALAQDPGGAVLRVALVPNRDLFFVPDGDVYYYLGLAAEAEGRAADAGAAFREFLSRRPDSRWAALASAHLHPSGEAGSGVAAGPVPRIVAIGTVQALGGIAAPFIDAAWRERPKLLDECLAAARGAGSVRVAIDLDLDAHGRVTRAAVDGAGPLGDDFARCAEAAVTRKLVVGGPARGKPTRARTEIIVAFP
jgi:tetratricopeptide (TPR) repeat protein